MNWIDYRKALGVSFSDADKSKMFASKIIVLLDEISAARFQNDSEDCVCRRYFSDIGEINPGQYYSWYRVKENITSNTDLPGLISYSLICTSDY